MGGSQSSDRAAYFYGSSHWDSDQGDVLRCLWRFESKLWRTLPAWAPPSDGTSRVDTSSRRRPSDQGRAVDPLRKLSIQEAFDLIPWMLTDAWVSPLVAFMDCNEPVIQSAGLGLLAKVLFKDSAAEIFCAVGGMEKVMALLSGKADPRAIYLALEVVNALCGCSSAMVERFCQAGLIRNLCNLSTSESAELVKLSLQILSMTLRQDQVKEEIHACGMLPILVGLVDSPVADIARAAVVCIGQSLPSAKNLNEIVRLGCIELFLKLMTPTNRNADAVIFALSLIAEETDDPFPRDLTLTTTTRMLETLRGGAKRSKAARAMSFLCASLAKSSIFHSAICTEQNLSILSKLLVGGSNDVLCAAAFALGVVALYGNDRVKHTLFVVDAPANLVQLIVLSAPLSSAISSSLMSESELIIRTSMFALAAVSVEGVLLSSGKRVFPELEYSDYLRADLAVLAETILDSKVVQSALDLSTVRQDICSTYALKLMILMSSCESVKRLLCTPEGVQKLLCFVKGASSAFIGSVFMLLLECCTPKSSQLTQHTSQQQQKADELAIEFSRMLEQADDIPHLSGMIFREHEPKHLLGFPDLLSQLVLNSPTLKTHLSTREVIDDVLVAASRLNHAVLHNQVVSFIDVLTAGKNQNAILALFECRPDRVANLLQASASTKVQLTAANVLRRVFKRLNSNDVPSAPALRHLSRLLEKGAVDDGQAPTETKEVALAVCRVWGNLVQYDDKRRSFAKIPDAIEGLLLLLRSCNRSDNQNGDQPVVHKQESSPTDKPTDLRWKQLYWILRTIVRAVVSDEVKRVVVESPPFLSIVDLFMHDSPSIVQLSITLVTEIARHTSLRKYMIVPKVLDVVLQILRDRDPRPSHLTSKIFALRLIGVIAKKDVAVQQVLIESKILEALLLLLHSPMASLNWELLVESLEALAWISSGNESPARRQIASVKVVDLTLRHVDSAQEAVAIASLHLLQRLSQEEQVKTFVANANGAAVVMRALQSRTEIETKCRASALVRNLVRQHDGNRKQFQALGICSYLVDTIATITCDGSSDGSIDVESTVKLQIKILEVIAALCEGSSQLAKTCKREVVESERSGDLLSLASCDSTKRLCAAWSRALAMVAYGSPSNQRRLAEADILTLLVQLIHDKQQQQQQLGQLAQYAQRAQQYSAQLLAYLAALPDNRSRIVKEGGDGFLSAIVGALQSDVHNLHRYAALLVANLTTRHVENKIKLGASGIISPLIDRLSSKQALVLENVLSAVTKLGNHAGNKVKIGSKVCFEKLVALIHHDELAIRKNAVAAIAVLVEGNDSNKKFLLQCEAPVVTELCALMKSSNGKIVESAMLILGEMSMVPEQTLEISKFIDILAVVRMIEHVNAKIRKAALSTVLNLTKESFNKLRFGIKECIDALLGCLVSDDLIIVESAITCLGNLSFTPANTALIAQYPTSLVLLLKLAAASTTSKDYLSWNESRMLRLAKSPSKEAVSGSLLPEKANNNDDKSRSLHSTIPEESDRCSEVEDTLQELLDPVGGGDQALVYSYRKTDEQNEEDDQQGEVLDFSSFPSRQTVVLEQTLLVLSNCAEEYHRRQLVEKVAVKVIGQALSHNSELVKRCACYTLACWCKKNTANQETATRHGVLPTLIQLLNAPNLHIVEAAMYALAKLCYFGDNHIKMLNLDILATLVQGILHRQSTMTQTSLLDRALRLLGTLVQFPKVRQMIKSEEIIADVLTQVLQLHRSALAKNVGRLLLAMLLEDSLKFFMPKKTVMLLRSIYIDDESNVKTVRNILLIFQAIASVEEHKTTIALEDSGETLGQLVAELQVMEPQGVNMVDVPEFPANSRVILSILATIANSRKIAVVLHEKHVYGVLPPYLLPYSPSPTEQRSQDGTTTSEDPTVALQQTSHEEHLEININAVLVLKFLCCQLEGRRVQELSSLDYSILLVGLLRDELEKTQRQEDRKTLSLLSYECLNILQRLCSNPEDELVLFQDGAIELLLEYLRLWHTIVRSGQSHDDGNDKASGTDQSVAPAVFIPPLANALLCLAKGPVQNRQRFVESGAISLLMVSMTVSFLSDDVRAQLLEALSLISPVPVASERYDSEDTISPLIKFTIQHRANTRLLLLCLQVLVDVVEMSPSSRKHVLIGGPQGVTFLVDCLVPISSMTTEENAIRWRCAINALQCLSTEKDVALAIAQLPNVKNVGQLLQLTMDRSQRDTHLFAVEMIGYMAHFGHADKLDLNHAIIEKILTLCDFETDDLVTAASIKLCMWTLSLLMKSPSSTSIPERTSLWIMNAPHGVDVLTKCAFFAPEDLMVPPAVVGHVLAILTTMVGFAATLPSVVGRRQSICTALTMQLEAVEPEIRLPALQLLALVLASYQCDDDTELHENWSVILRYLLEWMQVYLQDPTTCPTRSVLDAYIAMSFLTSNPSVAGDFKGFVTRSGLVDTVASTLQFFGNRKLPSRPENMILLHRESADSISAEQADQMRVDWMAQFNILLNGMRVLNRLMGFAPSYTVRVVQLHVPSVIENLLNLHDSHLLTEVLHSMNHLSTFSNDCHLLFSSDQCIVQLKSLLQSEKPAIQAQITPVLALMADTMPTLPGLCSIDGVNTISDVISKCPSWTARTENDRRVTEDCCAILLSLFEADAQMFVNFDIAQVVPKLFLIVERDDMPELPLRVLVLVSTCLASHPRFLDLLPRLCQLLSNGDERSDSTVACARLSRDSVVLLLTILFNMFCREGHVDSSLLPRLLDAGRTTLLPQLLPLRRWVSVAKSQPNAGRMVVKLLYAYLVNKNFSTLLNDGSNIPPLLELIASEHEEVAIAAAELLLLASAEKDVRIVIIVEDGIASLTRTLCVASAWPLQCLIVTLLRNMGGDTEVRALLLAVDKGVERIVEFVNARQSVLLTADERLGMSCEILVYLSCSPTGPQRIIDANGHTSILELSALQMSVKSEEQRAVTMKILASLAQAGASSAVAVAEPLIAIKLHEHFAKYLLLAGRGSLNSSDSSRSTTMTASKTLALAGLRALSHVSIDVRSELSKNAALVSLLESLLQSEKAAGAVTLNALAILYTLSKSDTGCLALAKHGSTSLVARVCRVAAPLAGPIDKDDNLTARSNAHDALTKGVVHCVKLLANLFSGETTLQTVWELDELTSLVGTLVRMLSNHERPKRQLIVLTLLVGSFARGTYFPLSPEMLVDLLNVLLISASQQHHVQAERILVAAFQDEAKIRPSIVGHQILEQFVIVFAQQTEPIDQRVLGPALVQVFREAITQRIFVSHRFLPKIVALLGAFAPADLSSPPSDASTDSPLQNAVCAYLSFAYAAPSTGSIDTAHRSSILDAVRSESNSAALFVLLQQLGKLHSQICIATPSSSAVGASSPPSDDISIWNCVTECLSPATSHIPRLLTASSPTPTWWLCLVIDWSSWLKIHFPLKSKAGWTGPSHRDAVINSCRLVSVLAASQSAERSATQSADVIDMQTRVCGVCLIVLADHLSLSGSSDVAEMSLLAECALQALLDARDAWGDECVLAACDRTACTPQMLATILGIFAIANQVMARARHLLLQLLLLLVSAGRFVKELKNAQIREAIEHNELIAAEDKAIPVTILGLLGYNADLNAELRQALARLESADSDVQRQEHSKFIDNFLQLYAVTDNTTLEAAIDVFMTLLVANTSAVSISQAPDVVAKATNTSTTLARGYLSVLQRLTAARRFPELFLTRWGLAALLGALFTRICGQETNNFKESSYLDANVIVDALRVIVAPIRERLDADLACLSAEDTDPLADLDEQTQRNMFGLVDAERSTVVAYQVVVLLEWTARSSSAAFDIIYNHTSMLRVFFPFVLTPTAISGDGNATDVAATWLDLMERVVNHVGGRAECLDELLTALLDFVYTNVASLKQSVRGRLLLFVLIVLQRMGDHGRTGSVAFERSLQEILQHVNDPAATELQVRCSWDLLGVLSALDPAISVLFNLDGVQILLQQCGCAAIPQSVIGWRATKQAVAYAQIEGLKCLARMSKTHEEVLLKVGAAPGIASFLFRALSKGLETDGGDGGRTRSTPLLEAAAFHDRRESTQEHAALLIARIASQEYLRAALLSQDNVAVLIESLESVHHAVVLSALEALHHLSDFSMCLDALVRHATVPVLAQIIFSAESDSGEDAEEQHARSATSVVRLLAEMCAKSAVVCRRVISSHLAPKLKSFIALQEMDAPYRRQLQHDAVWVLESLAKDTELALKLVGHGVVEAVCAQLSRFDATTTLPKALITLRHLVAVPGGLEADILTLTIHSTAAIAQQNVPVSAAQIAVAEGLAVFAAIAGGADQPRFARHEPGAVRQWLIDGEAIPLALDLLKASDAGVRLQAVNLLLKFVDGNVDYPTIRALFTSTISTTTGTKTTVMPLVSLVRAISDESRTSSDATGPLVQAALALLNLLLGDDALKGKLTALAYEVVLQVVVVVVPCSSTGAQSKVLGEALKALATMTTSGSFADAAATASTSSMLFKCLEPLVRLIGSSTTSTLRVNALFLLVNFASTPEARKRIAALGGLRVLVDTLVSATTVGHGNDKDVQLCLLGVAQLTTSDDWARDTTVVEAIVGAIDALVNLLRAKSASVQANAVWVVSNISHVSQIKDAIVARGGATALQAMLNESLLGDADSTITRQPSTTTVPSLPMPSRPTSSSLRIREYAPKAIKSLGFASITPPTAPPRPPPSDSPKTS